MMKRCSCVGSGMRLGRESLLTFSGIVVNAGLAFVVTWIIGRGLGAAGTGEFFQLTSLFMIAASVVGLGADTGLVRALSRQQALGDERYLRFTVRSAVLPVVAVGAAVALSVYIAAPVLGGWLNLDAAGVETLRVLAIALVPGSLVGVLLGGSRGLGRIVTYTVVQNLFIPIARLVGVAAVVLWIGSVSAVVWAWAIPLLMAAVLAGVALWRQVAVVGASRTSLSPAERSAQRKAFWDFSLPRGGAVVLERALDWADVLLVIALLGPAAGGIYGVVTRIVQAGSMLESAMRIVLGPRLSAAVAKGEHNEAQSLFRRVTSMLILSSWPFYFAIAVFAEDLLSLFGDEFRDGALALVILAAAMALRNTGGALQTVLLMAGKSTSQLRNKAVQLAVLIGVTLLLVPSWGITGAAVAYAIGVVVDTLLAAFQVYRAIGVHAQPRDVAVAGVLPVVVVLGGALLVSACLAEASVVARIVGLVAVLALYGVVLLIFMKRRGSSLG
jgi:O-antigen/teichoic acid export membrane protein